MSSLFEWNPERARENRLNYRVSFEEGSTVFGDPLALTTVDDEHSEPGDERLETIGQSEAGRILVVIHEDREDKIRLISARPAEPKERRAYAAGP